MNADSAAIVRHQAPLPAEAAPRPSYVPCIVIPFYRHEHAIAALVARLRPFGLRTYIVDDGSGEQSAPVLDALERAESTWLRLLRRARNGGKGAAVRTGFEAAIADGHTHAVQIDADGQHEPADIPRLLEASRNDPAALVTGSPRFDASIPRSRLYGRSFSNRLVCLHTLSRSIPDSMCGFRVYPLAASLDVWRTQTVGDRMDFDTEIMVRLYWRGSDVIGVPTPVRYPTDGVSHFALFRDNVRITRMHFRLFAGMLLRVPQLLRRPAPPAP
ncbi:MAG: glycosyl transferase [Panacagrimonas sp.]|nr:glycosyltransferase family 2 protein [Panacagrimonas sp.]MCC2657792.1 glycosyl transferase [Panacagrimonas sp.]